VLFPARAQNYILVCFIIPLLETHDIRHHYIKISGLRRQIQAGYSYSEHEIAVLIGYQHTLVLRLIILTHELSLDEVFVDSVNALIDVESEERDQQKYGDYSTSQSWVVIVAFASLESSDCKEVKIVDELLSP